MEFLREFFMLKCFSTLAYIMSISHLFSGVTFSAIAGNTKSGEKRQFSCNVDKNSATLADKTYIETACYSQYNQMYNLPLPFYGFVILSFSAVAFVYIAYSIWAKFHVEEVERSANTTDQAQDDHDGQHQERVHRRSRRVCYSYVFHLVVRFALGLLFTVLQHKVLYPSGFASEFTCNLANEQPKMKEATNVTIQPLNFTSTNCLFPPGSEKATWSIVVTSLNVTFASVALGEAIYIVHKVCKSRRDGNLGFEYDFEFCNVYLLRKQPDTYVQTPINLSDVDDTQVFKDFQVACDAHKSQVLNDSQQTDIQCGTNLYVSLEDMYVDLIIHSGRVQHEFTKDMGRHQIYDVYLTPTDNSIRIHNIKDLFTSNADTKRTPPRTILLVGRPGIGKTSLCRKIMFDWATAGDDEFYSGKIILLLKFRWFNSEKYRKMNLKQLLRFGTQVDDAAFEDIYRQLKKDPKKAIIIFDGLDECKDDGNCHDNEERAPSDDAKEMTVLSLFIKLVLGKFLKEATVLTTTRPTAQHIYSCLGFWRQVEILGFTPDKVEEYVGKFCEKSKRMDTNEKLWNHINGTVELLNLCYIPVNCYIICATLFQDISKLANDDLPETLTELYKKALKFFAKKHSGNSDQCDNNDIDKLAFVGMEQNQLIFDESEVKEHMKISGLLNSLPSASPGDDQQYCFIHLTIQEYIAARYIVEMSTENINKFFLNKAQLGRWHLTIQFVAGLLGDKMKLDASYKEHVTSLFQNFIDKSSQVQLLMMKCSKELHDDDTTKKLAGLTMYDSVNLANFGLTPIDCSAVVYFLKYVNLLRKLCLDENPLGKSGCLEISKLLQVRCLEHLSLSNCCVDDFGLKALVRAVQNMTCNIDHEHLTLNEINLSRNEITNNGVSSLCEALGDKNNNITTLDLSGNMLTNDGVIFLCNALKDEHCKLTTLDLRENKVTNDGVLFLCDALKDEHCNLTTLYLTGNKLTTDGISPLCDVLQNEHCNLDALHFQ